MSLFSISFRGRLSRAKFFARLITGVFITFVLLIILNLLDVVRITPAFWRYGVYADYFYNFSSQQNIIIFAAALFLIFIHTLSSVVRRLHDIGYSGWWSILFFVGLSRFYDMNVGFVGWPFFHTIIPLVSIFFFIFLCFCDGTDGNNRYGAKPLR